jgi:hypothetical protein
MILSIVRCRLDPSTTSKPVLVACAT